MPEDKGRKRRENLGRTKVGNGNTPYLTLEGLEELMKVPLIVKRCHEIRVLIWAAELQPTLCASLILL